MSANEKLYWYWLYNIEGIGLATIDKLLRWYDTPKNLYHNVHMEALQEMRISNKASRQLLESRNWDIIQKSYERLIQKNIRVVTRADKEYPEKLKTIYQPPGVLYVRGQLPREEVPSIAIVGARECSNYGKELALYFANELSKQGVQIISGLARGIDRYAHVGSMHETGRTYAILGSGIDVCYPKEHYSLYFDLIEHGGVISEYNLGTKPHQSNFPMRNRIISGLSDGILLVEARAKSGSLITMELGLDQGKNVYACPGRIFDSLSEGTNQVIQQGGKLVLSPKDILEDCRIFVDLTRQKMKKNNNMLERDEKMVYDSLSLIPKHMEEIMNETGISVDSLAIILFEMQLKGRIKQLTGNYYTRCIPTEDKE